MATMTKTIAAKTYEIEPRLPISDLTQKLNALVDAFQAAGELTVVVDLLGVKDVITLHIPLPKAT